MKKNLEKFLVGLFVMMLVIPFGVIDVSASSPSGWIIDGVKFFGASPASSNSSGTAVFNNGVLTLNNFDGELSYYCYEYLCTASVELIGDNKTSSAEFLSKADVRFNGYGTLNINTSVDAGGDYSIKISPLVTLNVKQNSIKDEENSATDEDDEDLAVEKDEEKKDSLDGNNMLVMIAVILNILLSSVIIIILVTRFVKNKK